MDTQKTARGNETRPFLRLVWAITSRSGALIHDSLSLSDALRRRALQL